MLTAEKSVAVSDKLIERLPEARRQSDSLFDLVLEEWLYERPIPERHRIIFYVGHLEAFDWNLLGGSVFGPLLGMHGIDPRLDKLFAFGIDPVGGGLPSDIPADWPALDVVRKYVLSVRAAVDSNLARVMSEGDVRGKDDFSLSTLLNVAVEHRLMHAETLAYMLHQLPFDKKAKQRPSSTLRIVGTPVIPSEIAIPAGTTILGLPHQSESIAAEKGRSFGWDNEYSSHIVEVPAFAIDRYMVTNRQYLEFMAAGGYEKRALWDDSDWDWRSNHGIVKPLFWRENGDEWLYRTMFSEIPLPLDWPVYVSHAEATAFARWAGKLLPTESEWQRAAYGSAEETNRSYPWGNELPQEKLGNFDFSSWDPAAVNEYPQARSAFGVEGMLGNGWEWTSTPFAPFPGFTAFPFYRGYSADFFDGKHFVMKGGSSRTAACMLRSTFRNWFQPHYQNVYAGFRCIRR